METKRFIGNDLSRLYDRVRREFGPDAAIIGTRTLMREGADPLIELTAAPPNLSDDLGFELHRTMVDGALGRINALDPPLTVGDIEDLVSRQQVAAEIESELLEPAPDWLEGFVQAPPAPEEPTGVAWAERRPANILDHPHARREDVEGLVEIAARRSLSITRELNETLASAAMGADTAQTIDGGIEGLVTPAEAIAAELVGRPVRMPAIGRPALVTVEGPVGAGKTTALMRIALDYADRGQPIALVSADTMHVGARAQVGAYADAIGLPWQTSESLEGVERAFTENPQSQWLLADMPAGAWSMALVAPEHCYRYLAFPCHWQASALERLLTTYDLSVFRGVILTFTDLAPDLTPILSLLMESQLGVAFLSSERDIATGMTPADISALASGIYLSSTRESTDGRLVGIA